MGWGDAFQFCQKDFCVCHATQYWVFMVSQSTEAWENFTLFCDMVVGTLRSIPDDRTPHRAHRKRTFFLVRPTLHQRTCVASRLKMSWAFESAFSQKSPCRHIFQRTLLGVLESPPRFPTTLVVEAGTTCASQPCCGASMTNQEHVVIALCRGQVCSKASLRH